MFVFSSSIFRNFSSADRSFTSTDLRWKSHSILSSMACKLFELIWQYYIYYPWKDSVPKLKCTASNKHSCLICCFFVMKTSDTLFLVEFTLPVKTFIAHRCRSGTILVRKVKSAYLKPFKAETNHILLFVIIIFPATP